MDLTSGFYNVPLHESDRKFTAFTTPMGLYEYNRLPQGLCNSPASFMRMMLSIFGDLNFSSLLCNLDDLLVFAPSEEEALRRLEVVFSRLRANNLKLSQKKCNFLRKSFGLDRGRHVRSYVRNCARYVLSKTPEPAARAPLESITTSAPLELVCIDFWFAEDNNNKSVDVLSSDGSLNCPRTRLRSNMSQGD
ncbi:hypothetical protein AAFF_G00441710 [Aldrovandia affinis]|uniref:ribonuclease H n=1 Tax=Aldrovandia affinis TaxID=143900 RepID=A0AAD7R300_9TELE|nr:hypothetical protein AAFF_G00441710 [Aldrovandia affinis]